MTPSLLPPLRLLLSGVLALSVALTMLGSGHRSCDASSAGHRVASPTASHQGMDVPHGEEPSGGETTGDTPRDCPEHDRHDERGAAACALAAHCATSVVASDVLLPAPEIRFVAPRLEMTGTRPLDAFHQPDPPPPKA